MQILGLIFLLIGSSASQSIFWSTHASTPVVYYQSTITVPPVPPKNWQTLFLWPGLSPWNFLGEIGRNYYPIDNGVLQPVLTIGGSCAPVSGPYSNFNRNSGWWISGIFS